MRAAAYARYSTDKQTENSIAYQFAKIEEYCANKKIEIVAKYCDEALSGTNIEMRTSFLDMLIAAKTGAFDAVVIYDISRGSRDVVDWFQFRKQMASLHIDVISVEEKLGDIFNPNDFLTELITVGLGQHQVLTTRQKSIDGVAVRAKQGKFLGGYAPLGYDIVNGDYVINPAEAKIVRKIFELYAGGMGYDLILRSIGTVIGKRGRPIGKNSLHSILTNERYIGVYTWNKRKMKIMRKWAGGTPNPDCVRIDGAIPPIITNEIWNRVQKRMNDNSKNATNKSKHDYLLSGLIVCDVCGAAYVGHCSTNSRGYSTRYYTCGNKYRTHNCSAKNINAEEIETFVVAQLKNYLWKTDFTATAEEICRQVNAASADLKSEREEIGQINLKIKNGLNAILNGYDMPELKNEIENLRTRKAELEDIIAAKSVKRTVTPGEIVSIFKSSMENWNSSNLKSIVQTHVKKIYAHSDGSCTVEIGVHTIGCGSPQYMVCTTIFMPIPTRKTSVK